MNRLGTPRRTLDRQVQKLSLQVDGEQSSFYMESVYLSFVLSLSKHGRKARVQKALPLTVAPFDRLRANGRRP